ncbi:MAG: DNA-binding response regulator [Desulfobacteraceae bacterium]
MPGILIADNEIPFVFEMVKFLAEKGYQLAGFADTAERAVDMSRRLRPDLVLMETRLSEMMDGVRAAGKIRRHHNVPIIFVTADVHEECLKQAKQVHPAGYVVKPFNEAQVYAAIEMALDGDHVKLHHNAHNTKSEYKGKTTRKDDLGEKVLNLTTAELKVAKLIKKGKRTRDIAKRLNVRCSTVDWHRKNIRKKLGLTDTKVSLMGKLLFYL